MAQHLLKDEDLRKLRAMQMVQLRVTGLSVAEIAKKFNISTQTVDRDVTWAIRNGWMSSVENDLITELAGEALRVYREKLKENSEYVAKHVIDVIVKLGDRFQSVKAHEQNLGLKAYIESKRDNGQRDKSEQDGNKGGVKVQELQPPQPKLLGPHDAPGEKGIGSDDGEIDEPVLETPPTEPVTEGELLEADGDGES